MNLPTLPGMGVGASIGGYIGYNAGPVFNHAASIDPVIVENVTNLWVAVAALAAAGVGHWLNRKGVHFLTPASETSKG